MIQRILKPEDKPIIITDSRENKSSVNEYYWSAYHKEKGMKRILKEFKSIEDKKLSNFVS